MYVEVYLFDAPYHIDRAFDYFSDMSVERGRIVRVPFGKANRLRFGVVTAVKESAEGVNIKPVHSVLSDRPTISEEMLGLCLFLKEYTLCTFGEALLFLSISTYFQLAIGAALAAALLGFSLLVVCEVLKEGARIKSENDLTV